jgi:hypothetical protein
MVANALVQFGYAEKGPPGAFNCSTRQDACLATSPTVETPPFAFASEAPTGGSCSTSCVIAIPALSPRVVSYQVQYRNSGNQVVAQTGPR